MIGNLAKTAVLFLATVAFSTVVTAESVVTEFAENAYVNTNGWDLGKAQLNTGKQLPGSVKMGEDGKGLELVSPIYEFDIAKILIGTAGSGSGVDQSTVELYGGDGVSDDWSLLGDFHPVNAQTKVQTNTVATVVSGIRQVKIVFNRSAGTLRVTTFAASSESDDNPSSGGEEEDDPPAEPENPTTFDVSLWRMSDVLKGGVTEDFSSLKMPKSASDGKWTNCVSVSGISLYTNNVPVTEVRPDTGKSNVTHFYVSEGDGRKSISLLVHGDKGKNELSMVLTVTNDMSATVLVTNLAYTACQWTNKNVTVSATLECSFAIVASADEVNPVWQSCPVADFESAETCEQNWFVPRSAPLETELAPGEVFLFCWTVHGKPSNPMLGVTDIILSAVKKPEQFVISVR